MWISYYLQDGTEGGCSLDIVSYNEAEYLLKEEFGDMWGGIADYGYYEEV